jgi:hypothetical protein
MNVKPLAVALGLLTLGPIAQANTIYSDNFDSDTANLNGTPSGWVVSGGAVDIVGPSNGWGWLCAPGGGNCVDLDGSVGQAGVLSNTLSLTAGTTYTATFDIAGNQRNYGDDVVDITFGSSTLSSSFSSNAAWTTYSLSFTPSVSGDYALTFHNLGGDNQGAVLDNVSIQAVPEPETYAMMVAGLGLMGVVARRRKSR